MFAGELELIWTFPYQEMPSNLVVRTEANWTSQDSKDQVVQLCSREKQDVVALSAPDSEFYALTTGGAHGITQRTSLAICTLS